jgi:uncharacterized membrane protein YkvA (DUF1232 family)
MKEELTLAEAMEKVGIDASNARERASEVRKRAKSWLDRAPAPANLKSFILRFIHATTDLDIPVMDLAILVAAAAYVIMPLDFIPDLIPILGWSDDVTIAALAMRTLRKHWRKSSLRGRDVVVEAPRPDFKS